MPQVIKKYNAKHGEVTITEYKVSNHSEYHVKYSAYPHIFSAWFNSKRDAIVHAQFVAGNY